MRTKATLLNLSKPFGIVLTLAFILSFAPARACYNQGPASPDGTGKFFMGREISLVMGHEGIDWLERNNRDSEESPSRAVEALALKPTDVVADIGAGSGYYAFRIAPLVPQGLVVAVDIQPEMLTFLKKRAVELGVNNVEPHLGAVDGAKLPPHSIDLALMVDAYHEFSHPREMLESLMSALRPGGRVVLLEFRAEDPAVPIKPLHKMTERQIRLELESVGFRWLATHDFLPWQHMVVFEKPPATE
jgi:ubiquinone/menaquinone biosynthesis C-methylase UbiE